MKKMIEIAILGLLIILVFSCRSERTGLPGMVTIGNYGGQAVQKTTDRIAVGRQNATALEVGTSDGDIHVAPGNGDTIQVVATEEVRAKSVEAAKAFLKQVKIVTTQEKDRWIVRADWPQTTPKGVSSVTVSFDVHAPAAMHLTAQSQNGDLNASGLADAHLRTQNGDIHADHIAGTVDAYSSNGSIQTEACADAPQVETQNGEITLRGVRHLGTVKTDNGSITIQMAAKQGAEPVAITSQNGTIDLSLPAGVSTHLEAGVDTGAIEMEPSDRAHFTDEGHTQMTADLGSGKGTIVSTPIPARSISRPAKRPEPYERSRNVTAVACGRCSSRVWSPRREGRISAPASRGEEAKVRSVSL
ncbi:MAG TPA: DUF4097 family beta strand repeat-containing protein [Chthonomonadaceae bacterium]|nr:DUF4097 family beta strand repeat-containing protein [Chthonomonadaceae bacterium]